jgi:hypothetical protein
MAEPTIFLPEDKRLAFAILSLFGLLGGIIMFLIAGNDKAQRFYGLQAIILGIIWYISIFTCVGYIIILIYAFYIAYKLYTTGGYFVPYLSGLAMKYS